MTARRKRLIGSVVVLALVALAWRAATLAPTAAFLMDLAGYTGGARALVPVPSYPFTTRDVDVPTRHGAVAARIYTPARSPVRTVVVFPGVHGGGLDEPRLARFCGRLARTGVQVVCAPLPELRDFRITGHSTDQIEDVTVAMAADRALAADGRVALVGVSFAGGLALVAAGRPSLADRLDLVLSVGGYGDLPRALRYLCTGALPDGSYRRPHDYGLAVVALDAAPALVPADQRAAFERTVRLYLEASLDDSPGQDDAARLVAEARRATARLPEPSRGLMTAILARDVGTVGATLLPLIDGLAADPALSPARSPVTRAPVFLIHGLDDNVIPSSETPLTAEDLRRRGNAHVESLLTPLLSHATLQGVTSLREAWRLVTFWHHVRVAM